MLFRKVPLFFVVSFFFFFPSISAQIDKGSKAENFIYSKFDLEETVQLMMNNTHLTSIDSLKLANYFSSELTGLLRNLVVQHVNDENLYATDFAHKTYHQKVEYLKHEFAEHGMSVLVDEVAEAIKRGEVFEGPFVLPAANGPCTNMDFEAGNLSGWEGTKGQVDPSGTVAYSYINALPNLVAPQHTIVSSGNDPMLCSAKLPMVNPDGGSYSVRLGDLAISGNAAEIKQTFLVSAQNVGFSYSYAVVLQDPNDHTDAQRPYFTARMYDANGNLIDCGTYNVISGPGKPGFKDDMPPAGGVGTLGTVCHRYKEWSTVFIPLGPYVGQNVTIVFRTGDCTKAGHYGYAYIDARCTPMPLMVTKVNEDCNNPNAILTAPAGGASYKWSPGGQTTQSITVNTPGHYEVTISSSAGSNCTVTLEYDYKAGAKAPKADFSITGGCLGIGINSAFIDKSLSNNNDNIQKWEWNFGDGSTSSAENPFYVFNTSGQKNIKLKVTNTDGCVDSIVKPVEVNPEPKFSLSATYSCAALPVVKVTLIDQVPGGLYEYRLNGGPWQTNQEFQNVPDGDNTVEVRLDGKCPTPKLISIKNLDQLKASVDPYNKTHCEGEQVTLKSSDASCANIAWFTDRITKVGAGTGCTYTFTMGNKDQCVYFEPTLNTTPFTVGASTPQEWGNSTVATFDVKKSIVIDGFTIDGDQYFTGCTNFAAQFVVKKGSTVIAGPVNYTIKCDRTKPTVVTGLGLKVPTGTGYTLEVIGATTKITTGNITQNTTMMQINNSGPFYNWKVTEAPGCPVRDSICVLNKCSCPDTTLKFPSPICSDVDFDLNTLKNATTAPGVWTIVNSPTGGTPATLNGTIFNGNKNGTAGDYTFMYTLTGGPFPNCAITNTRTIKVNAKETAKITRNQGPFCLSDGEQTLKIDAGASAGTWSGTGITDAVAGKFDPVVAGVGPHLITYKTNGICFVEDTITIVVVAQKFSDIVSPDTAVCNNAATFKIRTSANTTAGGTWLSVPAGLVNTTGFIDPTKGNAGSTYKVYYLIQGATLACSAADSVNITINAIDVANITPNQGPFCIADPATQLVLDANAANGTWSGNGVTATGMFTPQTAGAGKTVITYTTNGACPIFDTVQILVHDKKVANILTADTTVCKNSANFNLRLSANTSVGGMWLENLAPTTSTFNPTTATASAHKIYYAVQGFNLACSAVDSVTVTVNPIDIANITPNQGPFCIADPAAQLVLDANAHTGAWSGNGITSTGLFTPQTAGAGKTVITYTTDGACKIVDTVQILVHAKKIANILTADTTVCKNSANFNLRLSANTSTGGTWLENLAPVTSTFNPTTATVSDHRIYYAVQGFNLACSALDSVLVKVNPNADASITTPLKVDFCPNDEAIILQPKITPATGVWWSVPAGGISVTGEYNPALAQTGITKVFYGIAGMCGDTTFVQLRKSTIPVFDLGDDIVLCEGQSTQIGTSTIADQTLWNNNTTEPFMNVSSSGDYILTLTNLPNCVFKDTVRVEVLPYPEINLGNDTMLCLADVNYQMVLGVETPNFVYLWNTGETSSKITISSEGTYKVKVNYEGSTCYSDDEIKIIDYCPYDIHFPNAFTPNGDGINDRFPTPNYNLKDYHLMIFNRWGELIFESYNSSNLWDGTYNGKTVQEDVYVWKCVYKAEVENDKMNTLKTIGTVTVLR